MPQSTVESVTIDFECDAAGQAVKFERRYAVRISLAGKRLGRFATEYDCSCKDACPVAVGGAGQPQYDWSVCRYLHPAGGAGTPANHPPTAD